MLGQYKAQAGGSNSTGGSVEFDEDWERVRRVGRGRRNRACTVAGQDSTTEPRLLAIGIGYVNVRCRLLLVEGTGNCARRVLCVEQEGTPSTRGLHKLQCRRHVTGVGKHSCRPNGLSHWNGKPRSRAITNLVRIDPIAARAAPAPAAVKVHVFLRRTKDVPTEIRSTRQPVWNHLGADWLEQVLLCRPVLACGRRWQRDRDWRRRR